MSGDARYDTRQLLCACGSRYFVQLSPEVVYQARPGHPNEFCGLPVPVETPEQQAERERLPVEECVQCRTRYDCLGRVVV